MAAIRRLCRAVCDLYRLDRICREEIRRARDHPRIQCRRDPRPYDPDADLRLAAPGQAAQPRCAATRHRLDGILSDRIVWNVAPTEPDGGRIDCALSCRPRIRLEPVLISGRPLVLQSILLAVAVRAGRLVRPGQRETSARHSLPPGYFDPAHCGLALSPVRAGRDLCGQPAAIGRRRSRTPCSISSFPTKRKIWPLTGCFISWRWPSCSHTRCREIGVDFNRRSCSRSSNAGKNGCRSSAPGSSSPLPDISS